MPYRRAPIVILALVAATIVAFWPAYYGRFATAPWAFHFHGLTSTVWLLLLAGQAATIHRRRLTWHRAAGRASLWFFPVYLAGMAAVLHSMAAASPSDPFYAIYGARLGFMDGIGMVMVAWLYHRALVLRRGPHGHAHAMMATPLFLLPPIVGRLAGTLLPPLAIHGPAEFWKFAWSVEVGNGVAFVVALALWRRAARAGTPFKVSAVALAIQALLFPLVAAMPVLTASFEALGRLPAAVPLAAAALAGALLVRHGWAGAPAVRARAVPA